MKRLSCAPLVPVGRISAVGCVALLASCVGPAPTSNVPSYAQITHYPAPSGITSVPPAETRGRVVGSDPRYASSTGVVSSIDPVDEPRSSLSPGGAILGAVVGGVLGHQVGAGSGHAVATVAGVAGGALAGNAIGERVDRPGADRYRIGIAYDGGGSQWIDVPAPGDLRVGDRVRVDKGQIARY
jgi:outer membrane lipoprotein SlyB